MSEIINNTAQIKYVVSHNNIDVWHYTELGIGQVCTTGQPYQVEFATKTEALNLIPEAYLPSEAP